MKSALLSVGLASATHDDRLAQLNILQNTPGMTWQAGASTRFANEAPGASATLNGVKSNWRETVQAGIASGAIKPRQTPNLESMDIPEEFDSEKQWPKCAKMIGDIRDQSNCGCCWAFAAAEAASDRMCISTDGELQMPLSAQDVCFCASSDGCDGGEIDVPWEHMLKHGVVTGGQYKGSGPFGKGYCSDFSLPHCHHHGPQRDDPYPPENAPGCPSASSPRCPKKCDSDASGDHSDFDSDKYTWSGHVESASGEKKIQEMIMSGGPVETAFDVYSDFENYVGGVYQHVTGEMAGGHAIKMVGWGVDNGVKYWKLANSWNPYWGEKGYFRLLRGKNHCGIEDYVTGSSGKWHRVNGMNGTVVV